MKRSKREERRFHWFDVKQARGSSVKVPQPSGKFKILFPGAESIKLPSEQKSTDKDGSVK